MGQEDFVLPITKRGENKIRSNHHADFVTD
jgi:hypothetical protein